MTRRVILGRRGDGQRGIFVSPPGVDAFTAPLSLLTLSISEKVSQLLLLSYVTASQNVPLGVGYNPIVIITGRATISQSIGYEGYYGPVRPSPTFFSHYNAGTGGFTGEDPPSWAQIVGGGSHLYVNAGTVTSFAVFNRAI